SPTATSARPASSATSPAPAGRWRRSSASFPARWISRGEDFRTDRPRPRLRLAVHAAHRPPDSRAEGLLGRSSLRLLDRSDSRARAEGDRPLRRAAVGLRRELAVLLARGLRARRPEPGALLRHAAHRLLPRRPRRGG